MLRPPLCLLVYHNILNYSVVYATERGMFRLIGKVNEAGVLFHATGGGGRDTVQYFGIRCGRRRGCNTADRPGAAGNGSPWLVLHGVKLYKQKPSFNFIDLPMQKCLMQNR